MLRIRTQSWIDYIPSHLYYQRCPADQAPYQDRLCPLCLPAAGPILGDTETQNRETQNQPMPSVTGRAPRPQVLQQIPRSDAPDWHATLPITRLRGADPGGPRKSPPLPNVQRFPLLETESHNYVQRVCLRLENAPWTTAPNNPIIVLGRRLIT